MAGERQTHGSRAVLPFWQVIFWTTRRADAFDQLCWS
jgi:hypothetical protein